MNLDAAYRFLNFVANKEISGKTMLPSDYNANLETANLQHFNTEYQKIRAYARENKLMIFQVTEIGEALRPFTDTYTQAALPASGHMAVPPMFVYARSLRGLYSSLPKKINLISYEHMDNLLTNPLERSLYDSPACTQYDTYIKIIPKTMTAVNMTYLRRPRKPYYAYTQDTDTDGATYIDVEAVRGISVITMAVTIVVGGETVKLTVTDGSKAIVLGTYVGVAGDSKIVAAYGMAAAINERMKAHGYEAEVTTPADGIITIHAPIGKNKTDTDALSIAANNSGVTLTATVTTDYSASSIAVTGSTQLEWNEDQHMEIYKIILANMGTNLSDERLLAYKKMFETQSV